MTNMEMAIKNFSNTTINNITMVDNSTHIRFETSWIIKRWTNAFFCSVSILFAACSLYLLIKVKPTSNSMVNFTKNKLLIMLSASGLLKSLFAMIHVITLTLNTYKIRDYALRLNWFTEALYFSSVYLIMIN